MTVTHFEVSTREPYAGGRAFDGGRRYEQLDGRLRFAVDPEARCNQAIVDLARAPRDTDGRVCFSADFSVVRPVDADQANGAVIVELPNRGRRRVVPLLNMAPFTAPDARQAHPGDGFLFNQGFAVASIGWQWDVYPSEALMALEAPHAQHDGAPLGGETMVEMRPNEHEQVRLLADRVHRPLRAAPGEQAQAKLYVRDYEDGEDTLIARERWHFARRDEAGKLTPDAEHVYLEPGFEPGRIYQLVYHTDMAPVAGCGMLALRDVAAWLRSDAHDNPAAQMNQTLYAWGISQTGRMLRHFMSLGLNSCEDGRQAYDGIHAHVSGARRGAFNHRFAQPSNQTTPLWGHVFPFADLPVHDPSSGETAGLMDALERDGVVPRVVYTNTAAEYWRGDAALARISPDGKADLPEHPRTREYLFSGTQHVPGYPGQSRRNGGTGTVARYPINVLDYRPLLRAAFMNLYHWVVDDEAPPASAHPRLADGTAVERALVLERFAAFPGMHVPDPERLPVLRTVDMGAPESVGVGRYPAVEGERYPALVAAVDEDGNECAGIALPEVAVPVGTHAGWNPRDPETGASEQIVPMNGLTLNFPVDAEQRALSGDPRAAIAERYAGREDYSGRLRAHAQALAAARLLLAADVEVTVAAALMRYDAAVGG